MIERILWTALLLFAAADVALALESATLQPDSPQPGDIVVVDTSKMPSRGTLSLQHLRFVKLRDGRGRTYLGIDVDAEPGSDLPLEIRWSFAPPVRRQISVRPAQFPRDTGAAEKKAAEKTSAVAAKLDLLSRGRPGPQLWNATFLRPIEGDVVTPFGFEWLLDLEKFQRYPGIDIRGAIGAPVQASNEGKVVLAEELDQLGHTVVIDHGLSMLTVYGNLKDLQVQAGRRVRRGAVLGSVRPAADGNAPQLYWAARVLRARVDPAQLLALEALGE